MGEMAIGARRGGGELIEETRGRVGFDRMRVQYYSTACICVAYSQAFVHYSCDR